METIKDIVAEMRNWDYHSHLDKETHKDICCLADRIEAAKALEADRDNWRKQALAEDARANATQSVANCNQLKMREALVELIANIEMRSSTFGLNVMVDTKTFLDAKKALSAPPRNCDLYATEAEAWEAFSSIRQGAYSSTEEYENWLFAEAKG